MSKLLIAIGVALVIAGLLWPVLARLGLAWLGLDRLPGDIVIDRDGFRFYFPVVTSIVISVLITVLFWLR